MHDAAVAPGLMRCEPVLLLEQRHVRIGPAFENLARYGHADDATTDNRDPSARRGDFGRLLRLGGVRVNTIVSRTCLAMLQPPA